MKISIVMTTYNGETYIEKQIISLLEQSRKADEIIICDDVSSDDTVNIIQKYPEERKEFLLSVNH